MKLSFPIAFIACFAIAFGLFSCGEEVEEPCEQKIYYADVDGDGFGDPTNQIKDCVQLDGFVENADDLDDSQSGITTVPNTDKLQMVFSAIESRDTAGLEEVFDTLLEQHNPYIADGRAAMIDWILSNPAGITISNIRMFVDGDVFVTHSEYGGSWNSGTPQVVFDIYRFENGRIVEHWDNITDLVDSRQTDGFLEVNPSEDLTIENRFIIEKMTEDVFLDGIDTTYQLYFDETVYSEHSLDVDADEAKFQLLLTSTIGEGLYDYLEGTYLQGNFSIVLSERIEVDGMDTTSFAHYDLFRLDQDRIVEHWEVVDSIRTVNLANDNGKW